MEPSGGEEQLEVGERVTHELQLGRAVEESMINVVNERCKFSKFIPCLNQ